MLDPDAHVALEARLRSGLYQQIRGKLRDRRGFCAVGVLADIAVERGLGRWHEDSGGTFWFVPAARPDIMHWTSLPSYVLDELGFKVSDACRLTKANDRGFTFDDVAGLVRA